MELITAKIRAEESDRLKSAFLANLSHEIRTPMNAINGFTDLILNTDITETEKLEYLTVIEKSGKNLVSIIDDLIEMSKIDSNQIIPNYTQVNLESCMNELYETVKVTIQNKDIEFILINSSLPAAFNIVTDDIKLKQVIINLLTNAIKFTDKGMVTFGYEIDEQNQLIHFTVRDTGIGIPANKIDKLFKSFSQVDSSTTRKYGGTGLGLAISKKLVELMGGAIGLDSVVGQGCVFWVEMDLTNTRVQDVGEVSDEPTKIYRQTNEEQHLLLYVEDNPANLMLVEDLIARRPDIKLITARDGLEGVALARSALPDMILMDINLPGISGITALLILAKDPTTKHIPIVALSANAMPRDIAKGLEAGFFRYLTKPIKVNEFMDTLDLTLKYADAHPAPQGQIL